MPQDIALDQYPLDTALKINSRGPHFDAKVVGAGYHQLEPEVIDAIDFEQLKSGEIDFQGSLDLYGGSVLEVHHDRGPRKHAWPCFKTDVPFHHGMSGGPVLQIAGPNNEILACGIISCDTTVEDAAAGNEPIASIIWSSLYVETDIIVNPTTDKEIRASNILELVKIGVINDVMGSWNCVSIVEDMEGIPTLNWAFPTELDGYVFDCIQSHNQKSASRFLYVFFNRPNGPGSTKPDIRVCGQQIISSFVSVEVIASIPDSHGIDWEYVLIRPDYSGIDEIEAIKKAQGLASCFTTHPS